MIPAPWTPAEDETLREMFLDGHTDAEIGAAICRTKAAAASRRRALGIVRPPHRDRWVPEDDVQLRGYYAAGRTDVEIGRLMRRSWQAVRKRRNALGLLRPRYAGADLTKTSIALPDDVLDAAYRHARDHGHTGGYWLRVWCIDGCKRRK